MPPAPERRRNLIGAAVLYALSAAACCTFAAIGRAQFTDLHVYRLGGEAVIHGRSLYQFRYFGLPFTYPPFSAIAFVGLAILPWIAATALITLVSAMTVPLILYLALQLPSPARIADSRACWALALVAGAAAIWLEPARSTLGYGQIDLFLATGILYDLSRPDSSRWKGAVIGLAAGFKLTPAIFILYLLLTRRYRAAATGAAVFAATVAAGFVVLPSSSAFYWDATFLNPGHISPVQNDQNQSLLGALARTLHTPSVRPVWIPAIIFVTVLGMWLAASYHRSGNEAAGFSVCAITGLLISPISWTHHWVLAVPALLIGAVTLYRTREYRHLAVNLLGAAALAAVAIVGWSHMARDVPATNWLHMSAQGIVFSEIYVVIGLAVLALAAGCRFQGESPGFRQAGGRAISAGEL